MNRKTFLRLKPVVSVLPVTDCGQKDENITEKIKHKNKSLTNTTKRKAVLKKGEYHTIRPN